MPKPRNLRWNSTAQRFEAAGRDGLGKAYIGESGLGATDVVAGTLATLAGMKVGGGVNSTFIQKYTGTLAGGSIGTASILRQTLTGSHTCVIGDLVFGNFKADRSSTHVGVGGFMVPTTNTIDVWLQNTKPDSAGSLPATGVDAYVIRGV